MKLKGITKLVLAGTALAATAATLTTSTYAWYVTNTTVSATGVQGSVAGNAIDGSLFIAKNKWVAASGDDPDAEGYVPAHDAADNYTTEIQLSNAENTGYTLPVEGLNPQSKAIEISGKYYYKTSDTEQGVGKTYYTLTKESTGYTKAAATIDANTDWSTLYEESNSVAWVDKDGKYQAAQLLTFKFWLKSSAAGTAAITLKADNTTATAVSQTALAGTGLPTGINQGDSFVVDAITALRMEITQTNYPSGVAATPTSTLYQVDKLAKKWDASGAYATASSTAASRTDSPITFAAGGDANKYFNAILGKAPYGTATTDGTSTDSNTGTAPSEAVSLTLSANTDTLLTFNVWLEGSDADCFDSCRGQTFKFDFDFAFTASNS